MSWSKAASRWWCAAALVAVPCACGGANDSPFEEDGSSAAGSGPGSGSSGECGTINWRQSSPGRVSCPGSSNCSCDSGPVCCIEVQGKTHFDSSCSELTACAAMAFGCDGPEDCSGGLVCCAVLSAGGGSSCKAPGDCFGGEELVLCHTDDDCASAVGTHCTPAEPGSIFDATAASCAL